jgi:hypothetical protein
MDRHKIETAIREQLARVGVDLDALGPTCVDFDVQVVEGAVELWDEWARWTLSIDDALRALRDCDSATGDAVVDHEQFCDAMNAALARE